jgi:hypothetical protein
MLRSALIMLAALLLFGAEGTPAAAQVAGAPVPRVGPAACPLDAGGMSQPIQCGCTAEATEGGSIWGTLIYTSDSNPCRAARHAGGIGPAGGLIMIVPAPGLPSYRGSERDGVISQDYGNWGSSFLVAGLMGDATPPPAPPPMALQPAPPPAAAGPILACPRSFIEAGRRRTTCGCDAAAAATGSVWGTDLYTDDSSICRAALHAGAVPVSGGVVVAVPAQGQPTYRGSRRNGVLSLDWGAYGSSFRFEVARQGGTK